MASPPPAPNPRSWATHWDAGDPARADAFIEFGPVEVTAALRSVGFEPTTVPEQLRSDENRVFRVEFADGPVAVKVFRYARLTPEALDEQLEMLDRLQAAGVGVAAGLRLPGGERLGIFEGQLFACFEWYGDEAEEGPTHEDAADFFGLGIDIARMHEVGVTHPPERQLTYTPQTWGRAALDSLISAEAIHPQYREPFVARAEETLERAAACWPSTTPQFIHSDLGEWNVVWRPDGSAVLIDFEDLGLGVPWQDIYLLPHSLANNGVCDGATAERMGERLRAGYTSVRPLPEGSAELGALIEGIRGLYIDAWIAARRYDRHFSLRRMSFHTKAYWAARLERLERYLSIR
ncbi:MAG: Ser/Thr protein kinase RdoA (MazF antagonist) [Candidatus Aldehydirespiratoraceae bacterium]|jgi:Ser/Thr protein kinase RdoA (MazF antagonist)